MNYRAIYFLERKIGVVISWIEVYHAEFELADGIG